MRTATVVVVSPELKENLMDRVAFSPGALPNGIVGFEVQSEPVEVTMMGPSYKPDPDWSYTDPWGHTHTHARLTWHFVYDGPEYYFDADGEEYNGDGDFRCLVCNAIVEPEYVLDKPGGFRDFIAGPRYYWSVHDDGHKEPITEERYSELVALLRSSSGE